MTSLRNPVVWVYWALVAVGAWLAWPILEAAQRAGGGWLPIAVAAWAAYTVVAILVIRRFTRKRPRPGGLTTLAFLFGAAVVTGLAPKTADAVGQILTPLISDPAWASAMTAGITEEPLKLLGVYTVAYLAATQLTRVRDFMFYGVFVGLGFEVVESALYSISEIRDSGTPGLALVLDMFLRGVVNGLWSHPTYTAIAAFGLGIFMVSRSGAFFRWAAMLGWLLLAIVLHSFFDSPLLEDNLLVSSVVKGLPALLVVVGMLRYLRGREPLESTPEPQSVASTPS